MLKITDLVQWHELPLFFTERLQVQLSKITSKISWNVSQPFNKKILMMLSLSKFKRQSIQMIKDIFIFFVFNIKLI